MLDKNWKTFQQKDGRTDGRTRPSAISQRVCCRAVALQSAMEGYRHLGADQYSDTSGQCWFIAEQHKHQPCPAWLDTETLMGFHSCLCLSWAFSHFFFSTFGKWVCSVFHGLYLHDWWCLSSHSGSVYFNFSTGGTVLLCTLSMECFMFTMESWRP